MEKLVNKYIKQIEREIQAEQPRLIEEEKKKPEIATMRSFNHLGNSFYTEIDNNQQTIYNQ